MPKLFNIKSLMTPEIKFLCYTVGGAIALGVTVGVVRKIRNNIKARKDMKQREAIAEAAKTNITKTEVWFTDAAMKLAQAVSVEEGFNHWGADYDNEKILQIIKSLQHPDDWVYLVVKFGIRDGHNLLQWLGCDGSSDIASYNKALKGLGVEDKDLISPQGWFAGADSFDTDNQIL